MSRIFCCFITVWILGAAAASDDPIEPRASQTQTTLSGAWSGKAKVVAYPPTNLGALPIAIKIPKSISGGASINATFSQNGYLLSMQVALTTFTSKKGASGETSTGVLNGVIGNDCFYVIGVTTNGNSTIHLILTGHISSKGISGVGIGYGASDNEIVYSLKPAGATHGHSLEDSTLGTADSRKSATSPTPIGPLQVSGAVGGKAYALFSLTGTGKPGSFKGKITGSITASGFFGIRAAVLTINDTFTSDTYVLAGSDLGNNLSLSGPNSSATKMLFISLHLSGKGGKGVGILTGASTLDEFKLSLKKQ